MKNLLPFNGTVLYFPRLILSPAAYYDRLYIELSWQRERLKMFGKEIEMRRMVSWHADDSLSYSYSGIVKRSQPWTDTLTQIRLLAEDACDTQFNSCLANLYLDGKDSMGWHADNEKSLGKDPLIASVSLGAKRSFRFRHNQTGKIVSVELESGSMLFMGSGVQQHWKHSLPASPRVLEPRINLTFRSVANSGLANRLN